MFADRVNEGERDAAEEEEEGASERSERSLLSPPAARNRVSGDGHLALAGCSGKWPSNVTTNGHCWRTDPPRDRRIEGQRDRGREGGSTKDGSQSGSAMQEGWMAGRKVVPHFSFFGKVQAEGQASRGVPGGSILGCVGPRESGEKPLRLS